MERSVSSLVMRASKMRPVDSFTGWLMDPLPLPVSAGVALTFSTFRQLSTLEG
jgi:hypothetical protein